uniref:Uncharacterized protein n=1 Tax=Clandestinovirus TaxID=2831644 RepID=A0A8F8KTH4_9VIRU|nr:hypothetical protein KOM_12_108 [Clandestinovirus]
MKRKLCKPFEVPVLKRRKIQPNSMTTSNEQPVNLYNEHGTISGCWKDVSSLVMDLLPVRSASRFGATCKGFNQVYAQWYRTNVVLLKCFDTETILQSTDEQIMDLAGTERMNFLILLLSKVTKRCTAMVRLELTGVVHRPEKTLLACRMRRIYGDVNYATIEDVLYATAEDYSEAIKQHLTMRFIKNASNMSCHLVKLQKWSDITAPLAFVQKFKKYAIANTEHYLLNCLPMPIRVVPIE